MSRACALLFLERPKVYAPKVYDIAEPEAAKKKSIHITEQGFNSVQGEDTYIHTPSALPQKG